MANERQGRPNATGWVNPVKVKCGKCGTQQYVTPGSDPWRCHACGQKH